MRIVVELIIFKWRCQEILHPDGKTILHLALWNVDVLFTNSVSYDNLTVVVNDRTLLDCFEQRVFFDSRFFLVSLCEIFEVSVKKSNHSRSGMSLNRLAVEHAAWVGLSTLRLPCILTPRWSVMRIVKAHKLHWKYIYDFWSGVIIGLWCSTSAELKQAIENKIAYWVKVARELLLKLGLHQI